MHSDLRPGEPPLPGPLAEGWGTRDLRMRYRVGGTFTAAVCLWMAAASTSAESFIVKDGEPQVEIILSAEPTPSAKLAAIELQGFIKRISGARLSVLTAVPDPLPQRAIWIGAGAEAKRLFPGVDLDFKHPEEILYACDGRNLLIAGRDRMVGDTQVEHGTANAVYTFMQRELGIRWLWPGDLGTDVPETKTIAVAPVMYRFHPPIRERKFWRGSYGGQMKLDTQAWFRFNRQTLGSLQCFGGHAFMKWWEAYHEAHLEYFALLPNGTRRPQREPRDVKLCVSNPGVWKQWLDDAEKQLREDPLRKMLSASPNDGGGFCITLPRNWTRV